MSLFEHKFRKYFVDIIDHAYAALYQERFDPNPGLVSFYSDIQEIRSTLSRNPLITREDLLNELFIIWIDLRNKWIADKELQDRPLGFYASGISPWKLRNRLKTLLKSDKTYLESCNEPEKTNHEPLSIYINDDIKFLVFGSNEWPFFLLNEYERNLLYLYFFKNKSFVDMSKMLNRDREFLTRDVNLIIKQLRGRLNGYEKSNIVRQRILRQTI